MTEQQILTFAWRNWPLAAFILSLAYIVANKVGPVWLAEWSKRRQQARETEKAERETVAKLYERLMAQNERQSARDNEMTKFIASATEVVHSLGRSLDGNTQQLYRLTEAVERGPHCPLPDCPLYKLQKQESSDARA